MDNQPSKAGSLAGLGCERNSSLPAAYPPWDRNEATRRLAILFLDVASLHDSTAGKAYATLPTRPKVDAVADFQVVAHRAAIRLSKSDPRYILDP